VSVAADGQALDVTEAEAASGALAARERRFRRAFDDAAVGMTLTDPDGTITRVNAAFASMLGYTPAELVGVHVGALSHPDDLAVTLEQLSLAHARPSAADRRVIEKRYVRKDGGIAWGHVGIAAVRAADGRLDFVATQIEDVSELRLAEARREQAEQALRASEARCAGLVERARDAVFTADLEGNFTFVNPAASELTGYSEAELLRLSFLDLIPRREQPIARELLARRLAGGHGEHVALRLVAKDGRRVHVDVTGNVVGTDGAPGHIEGIARDVTDRHGLEEELRRRIFHDELTQLPNRTLLLDRLAQATGRNSRSDGGVAVLLLDIDDFKLVNDTLGHEAGDELLIEVAARLRVSARTSDTVARLGGDEFALVAEGVGATGDVVRLAERVQAAFERRFTIGGTRLRITASVGIAVATGGEQPSALLRDADTAMYRAKASGKGGSEFFDVAMRDRLVRRLELASALGESLHDGGLEIHYQPIVSLDDGELLAVEALLRWSHPRFGTVDPGEFVPLAEENGLIVPLGRHVIEVAARDAAAWRARDPDALPLGVFVNLSPRELLQESFVPFLARTLGEHGLSGSDLAFELNERVFIDDRDHTLVRNLQELTRRGIRLILDDFGTGYSALASLRRFPLAALKIDRYLISTIDGDEREQPVMRAIVSIGKALGIAVIAEGVESEQQLADLRALGCDAAQGYHLGRPVGAGELTELLAAHVPRRLRLAR
jgi:Amt family ammonium transporter